MADPLARIAERASAAMRAIDPGTPDSGTLDAGTPDAGTPDPDPVVRPSQHADAQVNGALALAKRLGRPPRDVATDLAAALAADPGFTDLCEPPEVAGPGFINVTFRNDALAGLLADVAGPRAGAAPATDPRRIVVDYSAPNVAKEMHVGHLRSTIIGDALARTLAFLGHDVIRQNHLGDWGTPFGMLIEHLVDSGVDPGGGTGTGATDVDIADLNAFYRAARAKFDDDPAFAERSRARVVALQAGDPDSRQLWQVLVDTSTTYFSDAYQRLEISLTDADYAGESTYNDVLDDVVAELVAKGIVTEDQGALCAFPEGFTGRDGEPLPLIVRKADGGYGYAATDLAALRHRTLDLGARDLLYVVGAPQHDHLEMVFAVGRAAGWVDADVQCEHVSFGSVLGTDGKMFRTRAGDTVRLADLVDEAVGRAQALVEAKSTDLGPDGVADVSRAIGIGAVKYADLSSDRVKDYVFDWDRMLALTGNTAPYLQYAHARICSILAKADPADRQAATPEALRIDAPAEHELAVALLGFDAAVRATADRRAPHRLCTYLFELASAYTTFYEACPVLRADDETQRRSRLALCALTANVLACGLDLLGIRAPERV